MYSAFVRSFVTLILASALALGAQSTDHHPERRLLGGLGFLGAGNPSLSCGSQSGLANIAALDTYNCPGSSGLLGGGNPSLSCGSQSGLVNVAVLDSYNCPGSASGPYGGPSASCGSQAGLINLELLDSYNCGNSPSNGGLFGLWRRSVP